MVVRAMVSAAGGRVSERVWCISDQMDFTPGAGRCPIAQQTVTYLFKLSSDMFNVSTITILNHGARWQPQGYKTRWLKLKHNYVQITQLYVTRERFLQSCHQFQRLAILSYRACLLLVPNRGSAVGSWRLLYLPRYIHMYLLNLNHFSTS